MKELDRQNMLFEAISQYRIEDIKVILEEVEPNQECIDMACRKGIKFMIPEQPTDWQFRLLLKYPDVLSDRIKKADTDLRHRLFEQAIEDCELESARLLFSKSINIDKLENLDNNQLLTLIKVLR